LHARQRRRSDSYLKRCSLQISDAGRRADVQNKSLPYLTNAILDLLSGVRRLRLQRLWIHAIGPISPGSFRG
jgi:hypothetical protein